MQRCGKNLQVGNDFDFAETEGLKSLVGKAVGNKQDNIYVKVSELPEEVIDNVGKVGGL